MKLDRSFQGLVMDLGVSDGADTAYYLAKGFQVIAVEADPEACRRLRLRFEPEIKSGALLLLNFAASDSFGEPIEFFVHGIHQGISGMTKRPSLEEGYARHTVMTVDWPTLRAQAGLPRYVKIDIEGHEEPFMNGLLASGDTPEFISLECYKFRPIEILHKMGYRRYKLVDQNPTGGFSLPLRQVEGLPVAAANFTGASGPFGLDVFGAGDWIDFAAVTREWAAIEPNMSYTWYDCHAWSPS